MSIISQSTQDSSGSTSLDSEPRCSLRSRCYDSLESVQQRLDYVKSSQQHYQSSINRDFIQEEEQYISNNAGDIISKNNPQQQTNKTNNILIVSGLVVIALLLSLLFIQIYTSPQCNATQLNQPQPNKYSLEKLLDPIQVKYIKSYEESAVGKYFYWDLLAEEYFKMIIEKLKKVVWMEEEFIEQFFDREFSQRDSKIIKQKVWKLRDKCTDIEVETNMANKIIWRYKNCFCL